MQTTSKAFRCLCDWLQRPNDAIPQVHRDDRDRGRDRLQYVHGGQELR